jgi:hypothetical protein
VRLADSSSIPSGAGLGGTLLDVASKEAAARGLQPVLDAIEVRLQSTELYQRRGWRRVWSKPWNERPELAHQFYVGPKV